MKAGEDTDALDLIVGNFTIFDTIMHALINTRSTHSYICTDIPSLGNLPRSETEYDILVMNPLEHSVIVNKVYRDCPIRIRENEFMGDLIELSFREFYVILGMDWLSRHQAIIDCRMKRVTLRTPNEDEVTFIGERSNHLSNVISAATARTMVQKGCEAYLAYVIDTVRQGLVYLISLPLMTFRTCFRKSCQDCLHRGRSILLSTLYQVSDECLKHSYSTHVSLSFPC